MQHKLIHRKDLFFFIILFVCSICGGVGGGGGNGVAATVWQNSLLITHILWIIYIASCDGEWVNARHKQPNWNKKTTINLIQSVSIRSDLTE